VRDPPSPSSVLHDPAQLEVLESAVHMAAAIGPIRPGIGRR